MPNWGWLLISHHVMGTLPLNWTFSSSPSALSPAQPSRLRQKMERLVPITWSDNISVKDSPESERPEGVFSLTCHTRAHTLAWTWERVPLGRRPLGCSAPLPHSSPSHFLIFPSAVSHPAPCTSVRGSCTIPWELQMWPRITHSAEGSSSRKPLPLPRQAGSNLPNPRFQS